MRRDSQSVWLAPALCFVLTAACSRASPSTVPVALVPCRLTGVGPVDSSWRQVRGSGFTFCIPGTWRSSGLGSDSLDPKSWSGREGSVTWGRGQPTSMYPPGPVAEATMPIVRVPAGMLPNPGGPTGTIKRLCLDPTITPITIDSVVVVVTQIACRGIWKTTAWSSTAGMYVQGQTSSAERAKLLNAIIVTLRFAPANH